MDKIELVCVTCKKIDQGNGVWSYPNGQAPGMKKDSICPECSHQRFPHFYSDYEKPSNHLKDASNLRSYIKDIFNNIKFV